MTSDYAFGESAAKDYMLDTSKIHLNSGSFGTQTRCVFKATQDKKQSIDENPFEYFKYIFPDEVRASANVLGDYIGAKKDEVVFTRSTTESLNAILRSLIFLAGDEVLIDGNCYNSTQHILRFVCSRAGARITSVYKKQLQETQQEIYERYINTISPRTRVVLIEHFDASTGLENPVKQITEYCKQRNILVCVDGAHAVSMSDVDMYDINADWYVGCCHKWLGSSRGVGFIWSNEDRGAMLRPANISRLSLNGYPFTFDWPGSGDFSGWMTVDTAIQYQQKIGRDALHTYCNDMVNWAREYVGERFETLQQTAQPVTGYMSPVVLPEKFQGKKQDVSHLQQYLREQGVLALLHKVNGQNIVRLSAYAYNKKADYEYFCDMVAQYEKEWF